MSKGKVSEFPKADAPSLKSGDGGGTTVDMEKRLTTLEVKVDNLSDRLDVLSSDMRSLGRTTQAMQVTLARIEGKLDSKVDWKWATGAIVALLIVILREELLVALGFR